MSADITHYRKAKTILQETADGGRLGKTKTAEIIEGQRQKLDRPVIVVTAAHRGRQKSMNNHNSTGVCQEYSDDAWASWELVNQLGPVFSAPG